MKNKILCLSLVLVIIMSSFTFIAIAEDKTEQYPELVITEIGADQYGIKENSKNTNAEFSKESNSENADPYEFIEIYNNSDKSVNVYDYMLAYNGAAPSDSISYEKSVSAYTPFFPGADWADNAYTAYDRFWKSTDKKRPVNPDYENGVVAAGEVFVAWVYNSDSHHMHCTESEFRSFWSIGKDVKVFVIDGYNVNFPANFSLDNKGTCTYAIMHQSDRFPVRRSSDVTYNCKADNKHHNYAFDTYETLEEIISWATTDFSSAPLSTYIAQNGSGNATTNYTVSYVPYAKDAAKSNGYGTMSFSSLKRMHIDAVNSYDTAIVGKLSKTQTEAFGKTKTGTVRTMPLRNGKLVNNNTNPELIITEVSPDQFGGHANNINEAYKSRVTNDIFEFVEIYNNSGKTLNIYDYMLGYQGSSATGVSTWFERSVQEYTPILPGADWIDAPFTAYDSFWKDTSVQRPVNPERADGEIKPGETVVIWLYSDDTHEVHATFKEFRTFWSVPDDVKVFAFDANSERDRNFNIKNSATGEYIIMKPSDRFPLRRSDDETYFVESNREDYNYVDKHFCDLEEVISWVVVDFKCYEPLYSFGSNGDGTDTRTNYTIQYAPYQHNNVFNNGFLTVSFESGKRIHLLNINKDIKDSTVGTQSEEQKAIFAKSK